MNYEVVRALVPTFWDGGYDGTDGTDADADSDAVQQQRRKRPDFDLALHIGMAGPQTVYSVERLAHRDGYLLRDVDGRFLDDEERRAREGDDWIWHGAPPELTSELDVDDIYKSWVERSPVGTCCVTTSIHPPSLLSLQLFVAPERGLSSSCTLSPA